MRLYLILSVLTVFVGTADAQSFRFIPGSVGAGAPTLIYINGGPGLPSSVISNDDLLHLLKVFNVVLVDQRGTKLVNRPAMTEVGKSMHAEHLALDHAQVIEELVARDLVDPQRFYVLGHSFGSSVAATYLRLLAEGRNLRQPKGVIMSAGATLKGFAAETWIGARPVVREASLPYEQKIRKVRAHLTAIGANPEIIHFVYGEMLGGATIDNALDGLMQINSSAEADTFLQENSDANNHLAHVLNVQSSNEGLTEVDILRIADSRDLLPDWVVDPLKAWALEESMSDENYQELLALIRSPDFYIPPLPTADQVRAMDSRGVQLIFHFGRADIIAGAVACERILASQLGPSLAAKTVMLTPGGHRDVRSEHGVNGVRRRLGL